MATLSPGRSSTVADRVWLIVRSRRAKALVTIGLVLLGPILAVITGLALSELDTRGTTAFLRAVILADFAYVILLAALLAVRIGRMVAARRRRSAGSRLHLRLLIVFSVVALAPTILVAVFAAVTINFGLETWFSDRVRTVLGTSLAAAQAYENEHRENLRADAELLARFLDANKARFPLIAPGDLRELLGRGQAQMQREILEAYVIDGAANIVVRGVDSYLFGYDPPDGAAIARALGGETVIVEDWPASEFRALVRLGAFADRFLYVTRRVDGKILTLLDETKDTVAFYNQLEAERGQLVFEFALIYLGFALLVILAAIWLGLWFADDLVRPVERLARAAERVGRGDLDVRVKEEGDDEIAMFSRIFNRMTEQVKEQRDALLAANLETERRRRLFAAVLSGVTAGVLGLDAQGRIEVANEAAARMLGRDRPDGEDLARAAPAFAALLERMRAEGRTVIQDQLQLSAGGRQQELLVRIAARIAEGQVEGHVVTFDDITDLVSAQRMAAWGDVARRIAHEIKNPLTPIQLSAERLRRKFGPQVTADRESFDQYAEMIIRQTGDLRRIVDEFSRFARMPAPEARPADLAELVREAVLLAQTGRPDIRFTVELAPGGLPMQLDPTLMSQCLTNLLKNAGEAIDARRERDGDAAPRGEVAVSLVREEGQAALTIRDNGIGLPKHQRGRLFEPYVTTREKGTGLGLPIVRKIVEEHGGQIALLDGPPEPGTGASGAEARITLPLGAGLARPRAGGERAARTA